MNLAIHQVSQSFVNEPMTIREAHSFEDGRNDRHAVMTAPRPRPFVPRVKMALVDEFKLFGRKLARQLLLDEPGDPARRPRVQSSAILSRTSFLRDPLPGTRSRPAG